MAPFMSSGIPGSSIHFSTLPTEVRFMTYEYLFEGANLFTDTLLNEEVDSSRISKITNIFRVNRQCYAEALPIFYKRAVFYMRNVRAVHLGCIKSPLSSWRGPTTAKIQKLFIIQSRLSSTDLLGDLFPSLERLLIKIQATPQDAMSLLPPFPSKIRLATAVFQIYEDMCRRQIHCFMAPPFKDILPEICKESRNQWVLEFLSRRIRHGLGKDRYKMCVKINLTDAIPWIDRQGGIDAAAFYCNGGTIVGAYVPDEQAWGFWVRDRQIMVPELLDDRS